MADSLLPYMNGDVTRWANDKFGKMVFFTDIEYSSTISCSFAEYDEQTVKPVYPVEEQAEKCPVVAKGFIAFILYNLQNHKYKKDIDFYEDYFQPLRRRHIDSINIIPGASHRDVEEEAYINHVYLEERNLNESAPVFDYLPERNISMLKEYNKKYLEYIRQYSKYYSKQFASFDQAITGCDINDKILLHSINNFCIPANKEPVEVYNDILFLRAIYQKEPGKCVNYIYTNYQTDWKEFLVIIHTIKTSFESTADIQLLLPDIYADENILNAYVFQKNVCRKKLTTKFDITPGHTLKDENPEKVCNTRNVTDELALYHLAKDPANKMFFSILPTDCEKRIEEYKSKNKSAFEKEKTASLQLDNKEDLPKETIESKNRIENFIYDTQKVKKIYLEYNDHLFKAVKELEFYNIIADATLNKLIIKGGMKTKFLYMICTLNKVIQNKDWYKMASSSVNSKPTICSGVTVPIPWSYRATSLIK